MISGVTFATAPGGRYTKHMNNSSILTFELPQVSKDCKPEFTAKRAEIVGGLITKAIKEPDTKYGFLLRNGGQVKVILGLSGHTITKGCGPEGLPEDPYERSKIWSQAARDMIREMNLLVRYGRWAAEVDRIETITATDEREKATVKLMQLHGTEIPGTSSGALHRVIGRCFNIKKYSEIHEKLLSEYKRLTVTEAPAEKAEAIQEKRIDIVTDPTETPAIAIPMEVQDELLVALEGAASVASFSGTTEEETK